MAAALGERAADLPVTAVKSMLGEAMGAAGGFQVVALLGTFADGVLPGIPGLDEVEDGAAARRLLDRRAAGAGPARPGHGPLRRRPRRRPGAGSPRRERLSGDPARPPGRRRRPRPPPGGAGVRGRGRGRAAPLGGGADGGAARARGRLLAPHRIAARQRREPGRRRPGAARRGRSAAGGGEHARGDLLRPLRHHRGGPGALLRAGDGGAHPGRAARSPACWRTRTGSRPSSSSTAWPRPRNFARALPGLFDGS